MTPVANWRAVLRRAWSIRFVVLAFVFTCLEVALPLLDGLLPIPAGTFAALCGLSTAAAFVSRLIAQEGISDEKK